MFFLLFLVEFLGGSCGHFVSGVRYTQACAPWAQASRFPPLPPAGKPGLLPARQQEWLGPWRGAGERVLGVGGPVPTSPLGFQFLQLFGKDWREGVETQSFEMRSVVVFLLQANAPAQHLAGRCPLRQGSKDPRESLQEAGEERPPPQALSDQPCPPCWLVLCINVNPPRPWPCLPFPFNCRSPGGCAHSEVGHQTGELGGSLGVSVKILIPVLHFPDVR